MRGCAISFLTRASVALSDSFLGFLAAPMSNPLIVEEALLTLFLNTMIEAAKTRVCSSARKNHVNCLAATVLGQSTGPLFQIQFLLDFGEIDHHLEVVFSRKPVELIVHCEVLALAFEHR